MVCSSGAQETCQRRQGPSDECESGPDAKDGQVRPGGVGQPSSLERTRTQPSLCSTQDSYPTRAGPAISSQPHACPPHACPSLIVSRSSGWASDSGSDLTKPCGGALVAASSVRRRGRGT